MAKIFFSDFFEVTPQTLDDYGAFNVSLVNDLPLFVDPFLLFNSSDETYQQLHEDIIRYVQFLRTRSASGTTDDGSLKAWYRFGEVKQNWLGYSKEGNSGSGLGDRFARSLNANLHTVFADFGSEQIARSSHLEKLCLISTGVGRDNISDFTTNLIKGYLLDYTQSFASEHVSRAHRKLVMVNRVRFNYHTETWESGKYELPFYAGDFVLLTPKDILTRDDMWISKTGLLQTFDEIAQSIPNDQLRSQINNYFRSQLGTKADKSETDRAIERVIQEYPVILDYYIRQREEEGDEAVSISSEKVAETDELFVRQVLEFVGTHLESTQFYESTGKTYAEARARLLFLKSVIEHNDGYRIFYLNGRPIKREEDVQILYRLTWFATPSDVNRETNNGRGPVDFKISQGSGDKTLVEFKLATNTQLKRNLEKQVEIYKQANQAKQAIKAIVYFSEADLKRVTGILEELDLEDDPDIILIDARADNKPSASKA